MKGIILAGGLGTRLYPSTCTISKQLLPVYDKPMIYYPLSVLMLAGIRDIMVISTPKDLPLFKKLLGRGDSLGIRLSYMSQPSPDGIAQAFILGKEFIGNDDVSLILGDNIFYGQGFVSMLSKAVESTEKHNSAVIFGYSVQDPERYGIISFDKKGRPDCIEEKPTRPKSRYAVTGLYVYPNDVVSVAEQITPSERGELEITSVNEHYLLQKRLEVMRLEDGFAWLDSGTHDSLMQASQFIETIEKRQGIKIGCIEQIAYQKGFISADDLQTQANQMPKCEYQRYLLSRIEGSK